MNIKDFIYSKKDEGIYRKTTIFGIKITTKPKEILINNQLGLMNEKIMQMNNRLNSVLENYDNFIRGGK